MQDVLYPYTCITTCISNTFYRNYRGNDVKIQYDLTYNVIYFPSVDKIYYAEGAAMNSVKNNRDCMIFKYFFLYITNRTISKEHRRKHKFMLYPLYFIKPRVIAFPRKLQRKMFAITSTFY